MVFRPVLIDYTKKLNGFLIDHFEWIFEGEVLDEVKSEKIRVDGVEISEFQFVSRGKINTLVEGLHRNRIERALDAITTSTFTYSDDEELKFRS